MNELQFGSRIHQILAQADPLDGRSVERLRLARQAALARQRTETRPAFVWLGDVIAGFGGMSGVSVRLVLPLAMLVVGLASIITWQATQRLAEVEEIDAQVLSGDLPIDAYLDRDFEAWLKRQG